MSANRSSHRVSEPLLDSDLLERDSFGPVVVALSRRSQECLAARVVELPFFLGSYELLECVGGGGMGLVYRAFDHRLHREVAVKLLSPTAMVDGHALLAEARAAAAIRHPNVVSVFAAEEIDGEIVLVSEWIEGRTLRWHLAQGVPPHRARRWVREIVAGVAAAHSNGIVHLDLKPENILIDGAGGCRVVDFGMSRRLAPTIGGGALEFDGGTPGYIAPERQAGEPGTPASDVYSLAIVIAELLGHGPRHPTTTQRVRACFERVPKRWRRALLRARSADPAKRPQNAAALLEEFTGRPWARRALLLAGALTVIALALLASGLRAGRAARAPSLDDFEVFSVPSAFGFVSVAALSPDGRLIATAHNSTICLEATASDGADPRCFAVPDARGILSMTFLGNSQVITQSVEGELLHIDLRSARPVRRGRGTTPVGAPNGRNLAYHQRTDQRDEIVVWSREATRRFPIRSNRLGIRLAFAPDSRVLYVLAGSSDGATIQRIDLSTGATDFVLRDARTQIGGISSFVALVDGLIVARIDPPHRGASHNLWWLPLTEDGAAAGPWRQLTSWSSSVAWTISASVDGRNLLALLASYDEALYLADVDRRDPDRLSLSGFRRMPLAAVASPLSWRTDSELWALHSDRAGYRVGVLGTSSSAPFFAVPWLRDSVDVQQTAASVYALRRRGHEVELWRDGARLARLGREQASVSSFDDSRFVLRCGEHRCLLGELGPEETATFRWVEGDAIRPAFARPGWDRALFRIAISRDAERIVLADWRHSEIVDGDGVHIAALPRLEGCAPIASAAFVGPGHQRFLASAHCADASAVFVSVDAESGAFTIAHRMPAPVFANHLRINPSGTGLALHSGQQHRRLALMRLTRAAED